MKLELALITNLEFTEKCDECQLYKLLSENSN